MSSHCSLVHSPPYPGIYTFWFSLFTAGSTADFPNFMSLCSCLLPCLKKHHLMISPVNIQLLLLLHGAPPQSAGSCPPEVSSPHSVFLSSPQPSLSSLSPPPSAHEAWLLPPVSKTDEVSQILPSSSPL
ncbi:hypothetical protein ILYODFUR_031025 [Ilyodon furcidens]|uniref:Uncharacterized protein n=1 Tax=Ilyodon furcidens TaxID=33524 RepID=A0ABV0V7K8_9TELE